MEIPYDPFNLKDSHSVDDYKRALLACRPLLSGRKYLEMLKANYFAPEHTITAGQMATAVGYANWSSANVQYGKFAGAIAQKLGHVSGQLEGVAGAVTPDVAILVSFHDGATTGEEVHWRLLPAVVQALEEMRWVRKP
jgi:hypothetical protein